MRRRLFALLAALIAVAGCAGATHGGSRQDRPSTTATPSATDPARSSGPPKVLGTIASGLSVPWGIAFLPDGSALVTERDTGRVLHLTGSGTAWRSTTVGIVPEHSTTGGEGGLLGIAVSPAYARNHRVFLYVSTTRDNRVVTARLVAGRLGATTPPAPRSMLPSTSARASARRAYRTATDTTMRCSARRSGNAPDCPG